MRTALLAAIGAACAFVPATGLATIPGSYGIQLQARASVGTGATTFNLPGGSAFTSATPDINNNRRVAFKVLSNGAAGGNEAIWYGGTTAGSFGAGSIVYTAPDFDTLLSDPALNNNNVAVFPQTFSTTNGIFKYDAGTNTSGLHTNGPLGASSWSSPRMNDSGQVGTRVGFSSGQAYVSYDVVPSTLATHATDKGLNPNSPYNFLSTGNFDNSRRIAGRVNIGATFNNSNPDQVRIFNADGSSTLIAEDQDSNPIAQFTRFDNTQPGMNDNGWVAFIGWTTTSSASRGVYLSNGVTTIPIATPGAGLTSIDNFSPAVNNSNEVVFRATDLSGNISVFVGNGSTLRRVIGIGDTMMTDEGIRTINSLGGNPTLNDLGDIAFGGGLGPGGNFIAVALVPEPAVPGLVGAIGMLLLQRRRRID